MPTLRDVRDALAWSQRDLAARAGVSKTTVYAIEQGRGPVRPSTRRKLAEALGVAPASIAWPGSDRDVVTAPYTLGRTREAGTEHPGYLTAAEPRTPYPAPPDDAAPERSGRDR